MVNYDKDYRLFACSEYGISGTKMDSFEKYMQGYIEPYILEEREMNVTQMSVFSRLFKDRILFLGTDINSDTANILASQLMFLNSLSEAENIKLYINSPGGSVADGLMIYDVMNFVTPKVETYCLGTSASMAAVLLSSGTEGKRYALPHSQIMIHQPSGGTGRVKSDELEVAWNEMKKCKDTLYSILAENTGKTVEELEELCRLDKWYTPDEAVDAHLIDMVIKNNRK